MASECCSPCPQGGDEGDAGEVAADLVEAAKGSRPKIQRVVNLLEDGADNGSGQHLQVRHHRAEQPVEVDVSGEVSQDGSTHRLHGLVEPADPDGLVDGLRERVELPERAEPANVADALDQRLVHAEQAADLHTHEAAAGDAGDGRPERVCERPLARNRRAGDAARGLGQPDAGARRRRCGDGRRHPLHGGGCAEGCLRDRTAKGLRHLPAGLDRALPLLPGQRAGQVVHGVPPG